MLHAVLTLGLHSIIQKYNDTKIQICLILSVKYRQQIFGEFQVNFKVKT